MCPDQDAPHGAGAGLHALLPSSPGAARLASPAGSRGPCGGTGEGVPAPVAAPSCAAAGDPHGVELPRPHAWCADMPTAGPSHVGARGAATPFAAAAAQAAAAGSGAGGPLSSARPSDVPSDASLVGHPGSRPSPPWAGPTPSHEAWQGAHTSQRPSGAELHATASGLPGGAGPGPALSAPVALTALLGSGQARDASDQALAAGAASWAHGIDPRGLCGATHPAAQQQQQQQQPLAAHDSHRSVFTGWHGGRGAGARSGYHAPAQAGPAAELPPDPKGLSSNSVKAPLRPHPGWQVRWSSQGSGPRPPMPPLVPGDGACTPPPLPWPHPGPGWTQAGGSSAPPTGGPPELQRAASGQAVTAPQRAWSEGSGVAQAPHAVTSGGWPHAAPLSPRYHAGGWRRAWPGRWGWPGWGHWPPGPAHAAPPAGWPPQGQTIWPGGVGEAGAGTAGAAHQPQAHGGGADPAHRAPPAQPDGRMEATARDAAAGWAYGTAGPCEVSSGGRACAPACGQPHADGLCGPGCGPGGGWSCAGSGHAPRLSPCRGEDRSDSGRSAGMVALVASHE
jgi:hypothetical protein